MRKTAGRQTAGEGTCIGELHIEEIARVSNVALSESQFIATDNIRVHTYLGREYLDSIGNFCMGTPFKIRFTMLIFCTEGSMEVQLNLTRHTLEAGQMLLVHQGMVATGVRIDPEIRLFIMGFTQKFTDSRPPSRIGSSTLSRLMREPVISLEDSEMTDIFAIYNIINSRLAGREFNDVDELAWNGLLTICCLLANHMDRNPAEPHRATRREMIVRDFLQSVGQWATTRRDIPYYARMLCVSPKYLGQIVTDVTGETPRRWICRQVVLEAKALLDDPTLTVQQISQALNFANQSFFGTFFRRHTGLSPKAYRRRQ